MVFLLYPFISSTALIFREKVLQLLVFGEQKTEGNTKFTFQGVKEAFFVCYHAMPLSQRWTLTQ